MTNKVNRIRWKEVCNDCPLMTRNFIGVIRNYCQYSYFANLCHVPTNRKYGRWLVVSRIYQDTRHGWLNPHHLHQTLTDNGKKSHQIVCNSYAEKSDTSWNMKLMTWTMIIIHSETLNYWWIVIVIAATAHFSYKLDSIASDINIVEKGAISHQLFGMLISTPLSFIPSIAFQWQGPNCCLLVTDGACPSYFCSSTV